MALEPYAELHPILPDRVDFLLELHEYLVGRPEFWAHFIHIETKFGRFVPLPSADEWSEQIYHALSPEMKREFEAFLDRRRERYARGKIPKQVTYGAVRQARAREHRGA